MPQRNNTEDHGVLFPSDCLETFSLISLILKFTPETIYAYAALAFLNTAYYGKTLYYI